MTRPARSASSTGRSRRGGHDLGAQERHALGRDHPLREPSAVELRAELPPGVRPSEVQALLDEQVATPTRADPHVDLEEVDSDRVVVRIAATPRSEDDGAKLADEVLAAVGKATQEDDPPPG